ncbi:MAG TPA: GTPase Era [Candidatus Aveggerthella stercoripullorum]|uniref:GTPase Era n=1 Tax=Candidatus Aveggerthella stercoripullorum TaxID=2840688 RepID=A0A9D1A0C2_9ACTN|nr:GTPase Era [Candidatus Aveggerthella stercoripullorum]
MDGADVQESEGAYEESELEESDWLDEEEDEDAGLSLDEMIAAALGSTDGQTAAPVTLEEGFRSGFVTLVGRPNAGKSTLLNAIMGKKIAITSNTAQTTRHRFRAVLTRPDFQMVIVDTPGIHKPHDVLGEELNVSALEALKDVDVVAFLVDASKPVGRGDAWVANALKGLHAKKILVLSKTDLATDEQVERQRQAADELGEWDAYVALSSKTGENVDGFVAAVAAELPEGPQWFPDDMETDQPIEVIVAEFVREKILRSFRDEIPHAIGVVVEEMEYKRKANLNTIYATVYVERDSQKGIIIGKGGAAIKMIGSEARADLEQLLGTRVFLDLRVKVKKNWRRDLNQIRRFGYGEGI